VSSDRCEAVEAASRSGYVNDPGLGSAGDDSGDGVVDWETSGVGDPSGATVADSELNRRAMAELLVDSRAGSANEASQAASVSSAAPSGVISEYEYRVVPAVSPPAVPIVVETFAESYARLGWTCEILGDSPSPPDKRKKRRRTNTVRRDIVSIPYLAALMPCTCFVQQTGTVMCRFDGSAPVKEYQNADLLVNAFWWLFWRGQGAYNNDLFIGTVTSILNHSCTFAGGFEDDRRGGTRTIPFGRHFAHLLRRADKRYRVDPVFKYVVFNILERRRVVEAAKFRVSCNEIFTFVYTLIVNSLMCCIACR
jgi:hypothetical protein